MTLEGAIAVTRFGLGARPGDIEQASVNPKKWLKSQLIENNVYQFPNETLHTSQDYIIEKEAFFRARKFQLTDTCLLYTSPSPRDQRGSRMPSSA